METLKRTVGKVTRWVAEEQHGTEQQFLATSDALPRWLETMGHDQLRVVVQTELSAGQRTALFHKVWELGKMDDPRIEGATWGEDNAFCDTGRLKRAMHRTGAVARGGVAESNLRPVRVLPSSVGEGGSTGAQFFCLAERLGHDPNTGRVCYVNGMGVATLDHAGRDAATIADRFCNGFNIHVVYNPTHQSHNAFFPSLLAKDIIRMKAVEAGSCARQTLLIAQQWIDFLNRAPTNTHKCLQIAHSEGAVHVHRALQLLLDARPDLLPRIRLLNFCPAYFVDQTLFPGLQAVNFVKQEDTVILPWATNASFMSDPSQRNVVIVKHTIHSVDDHNHPHDMMSFDFVDAAAPFFQKFFACGDIL